MSKMEGTRVPGYRSVPVGYYEKEIIKLRLRVKELEDKVDRLQELVDQYEWVMGDYNA